MSVGRYYPATKQRHTSVCTQTKSGGLYAYLGMRIGALKKLYQCLLSVIASSCFCYLSFDFDQRLNIGESWQRDVARIA
jgi:hypothetical protein